MWQGVLIGLVATLLLILPVSAHVLVTEQTVGVVLHMTPDDDPIAGQETIFSLIFKDTATQFTVANCQCQLQLVRDNRLYATYTIEAMAVDQGQAIGTFPDRGQYTLRIVGQPKTPGSFQEFTIEKPVTVQHQASPLSQVTIQATTQPVNKSAKPAKMSLADQLRAHWLHLTGVIIGAGVFVYSVERDRRRKRD